MKPGMKKLLLHKETIAGLNSFELGRIVGGNTPGVVSATCHENEETWKQVTECQTQHHGCVE